MKNKIIKKIIILRMKNDDTVLYGTVRSHLARISIWHHGAKFRINKFVTRNWSAFSRSWTCRFLDS